MLATQDTVKYWLLTPINYCLALRKNTLPKISKYGYSSECVSLSQHHKVEKH